MKHELRLFARRVLPNYFISAACCAYLHTLGWLSGRHRGLLYQINEHFQCNLEYPRRQLPLQTLNSLPWINSPVKILEPLAANGNVSVLELLVLATATAAFQPGRVFEIGTFDGRTTLNLAMNAPANAKLFTLDLPQNQLDDTAHAVLGGDKTFVRKAGSGARFRDTPAQSRIQQLYGDSANFDYAPYQSNIDLIFVDGAHAYDYVISDSRKALAMRRSDKSLIFWHDYGAWPDVTEALNHLHKTEPAFANLKHIEGTCLAYLA